MDQIRATDTFRDMPTRFLIHGRAIPKSALRRNDLAQFYIMYGGKLVRQEKKPLKHFRAPTHKKTSLEKKHDRHKHSLTKDHKGSLSHMRHAAEKQSLKRPARFHIADAATDARKRSSFRAPSSTMNSRNGLDTGTSDETDTLTDEFETNFSFDSNPKQQPRLNSQANSSDLDGDF